MIQSQSLSRRMAIGVLLPCMLDSLVLFILAWLGSALWINSRLDNLPVTIPLATLFAALACTASFSWQLARRRRRQRAIQEEAFHLWLMNHIVHGSQEDFKRLVVDLLDAARQYSYLPSAREPFLRMNDGDRFIGVVALKRHPSCPVDAQTLMSLVDMARSHKLRSILIVCSAAFDPAALEFARNVTAPTLELIDSRALAAMARQTVVDISEQEVAGFWSQARDQIRSSRRRGRSFASLARPLRFLICGAVLLGLSFLTPFSHWYLAMAVLCGLLAALTGVLPLIIRTPAQPKSITGFSGEGR